VLYIKKIGTFVVCIGMVWMISSESLENGQWFIVSYDSANKQEHYKKSLHWANQPQ